MKNLYPFLLFVVLTMTRSYPLAAQPMLKYQPTGDFCQVKALKLPSTSPERPMMQAGTLCQVQSSGFGLANWEDMAAFDAGMRVDIMVELYPGFRSESRKEVFLGPFSTFNVLSSSGGRSGHRGSLGWHLGFKTRLRRHLSLETALGIGGVYATNYPAPHQPTPLIEGLWSKLDAVYRLSLSYQIGA